MQPPLELLADPDSPISNMLNRLALPGPGSIEVSCEMWPDRIEASQNIPAYLEWHEKVRPGGSLHRGNGLDQHENDLHARGKSIKDISQALILMMDRFHSARDDQDPLSESDPPLPEGAGCVPFDSLEPFFHPVRCYAM